MGSKRVHLRTLTVLVIFFSFAGGLAAEQAQPVPLSFNLTPYATIPYGTDANTYVIGYGSRASLDYILPKLPSVSIGLLGDYTYLTTKDPSFSLYLAGGGLQAGFNLKVLPILSVLGSGAGGVYTAGTQPTVFHGLGGWFSGGMGLGLNLNEFLSFNLSAAYQMNTQKPDPNGSNLFLYTGTAFSLSVNLMPAGNSPFIFDTTVPDGYTPIIKEKKGLK